MDSRRLALSANQDGKAGMPASRLIVGEVNQALPSTIFFAIHRPNGLYRRP
jgi:hypothetical protein